MRNLGEGVRGALLQQQKKGHTVYYSRAPAERREYPVEGSAITKAGKHELHPRVVLRQSVVSRKSAGETSTRDIKRRT